MKKRFLALLLAAALGVSLCACTPKEEDSGKLSVVCSLFPYYDFVREIGGEFVQVHLLVAAGREAHSFEPTPMDVIRVSRADVFVYNGGEGEQWVEEILASAGEAVPTVVRMMDYADTVEEEPLEYGHDGHEHDDHSGHEHDSDEIEYDEHIWTSPVEAMKLCRAICDALCAAAPAHAEVFRGNLENYLRELSALDADFRQVCSEKKRSLLVFGDRFPLLGHGAVPLHPEIPHRQDGTGQDPGGIRTGIEQSKGGAGHRRDNRRKGDDILLLPDGVRRGLCRRGGICESDAPKRGRTERGDLLTVNENILLACRDASLGYEGKAVWEHLDFQVRRGDYICIVGENGSGKSTLLKSLLGLIRPLSGHIDRAESLKAGAIGYLPQQTRAQKDFPATVTEVVRSGFLSAGGHRLLYTPAQKATALLNMGKLGILELKDKCYRELSGGQQQRVLLARALCAAGDLLVLDEPVTGLDPAAADDLYRTLRYLNRTEGMAVVMVTHDIRSALRDAAAILHAGRDQWFLGTPGEYLASPYGKRFGGDLS